MPDTMVKTMQGDEYHVLNLQGKPYAPVNQRVESAVKHGGYTVLSCEYKVIFERQVCEVWIQVGENKFCGTAEIKKDFSRPLEDGQTSAIGRALGFAGFDIERAIASKEDIDSAQMPGATVIEAEAPRQLPQRTQPVKVVAKQLPAPQTRVPTIPEQCRALSRHLNYSDEAWADLCQQYTVNKKVNFEEMKAQLMRETAQKAQVS